MNFLNFTEFQDYVISCYLIILISILILITFIITNNIKQRKLLQLLEKKIAKKNKF